MEQDEYKKCLLFYLEEIKKLEIEDELKKAVDVTIADIESILVTEIDIDEDIYWEIRDFMQKYE